MRIPIQMTKEAHEKLQKENSEVKTTLDNVGTPTESGGEAPPAKTYQAPIHRR